MAKTKDYIFNSTNFEQGQMDGGTGAKQPDSHFQHNTRVRSKDFVPVMSGRTVEYSGSLPQYFWVFEYDENKNYLRYGSKTTNFHYRTAFIKITCASAESYDGTVTMAPSALAGGKMTMTGRDLEFGKLPDGKVYTKGRNFLLDTQNMTYNNAEVYDRLGVYHDTESLFNGCATIETNRAWQGYKINFRKIAERCGIRAGDKVTYSIWTKFQGIPTHERCSFTFGRSKDSGASMPGVIVFDKPKAQIVSGSWFQVKATFTVTEDDLEVSSMRIGSNYYDEDNTYKQINSQVWFACPKLEYGDTATAYSPAPEDYVNRTCADYDLTV